MIWLTGSIVRHTLPTELGLRIGIHLVYTGVLTAPPLWLLLAAQPRALALPDHAAARRRCSWRSRRALFFLALLTNDGHRLMLREFSVAGFERGPSAFAGPLFWVFMAWAFACVLVGVGFFLASVRNVPTGAGERRRGALLALGALLPVASSTIYLFQLVPVRCDTTPFGFTAAIALFYVALFRYRLLESLPLAREDVLRAPRGRRAGGGHRRDRGGAEPGRAAHPRRGARDLRGRSLAEAIARLATPGARALPARPHAAGARAAGGSSSRPRRAAASRCRAGCCTTAAAARSGVSPRCAIARRSGATSGACARSRSSRRWARWPRTSRAR